MFQQDVTDLSPVVECERGLELFLVPPSSRDDPAICNVQMGARSGGDLMFFLTRSHRTLTYSDGGD